MRTRTRGYGQTDMKKRLRKKRTVMKKTGSYEKDGQLWKRRAVARGKP